MLHASSVDLPSLITYPKSFAPSTGSLLNKGLLANYFSLLTNLCTALVHRICLISYSSMFLPVNSAHPLIPVCFTFLPTVRNILVKALFLTRHQSSGTIFSLPPVSWTLSNQLIKQSHFPPSIWFYAIRQIDFNNSPLSCLLTQTDSPVVCVDCDLCVRAYRRVWLHAYILNSFLKGLCIIIMYVGVYVECY